MSESSDERSPGFSNNKLTGKLIAAGVFVVIGTVIVAWSMNYCKECAQTASVAKNDQENQDSDNKEKKSAVSDTVPSLKLKNVAGSNSQPSLPQAGSSTKPDLKNKGSRKQEQSATVGTFKPISAPKKQSVGGSFTLPESKSFGGGQSSIKKSPATEPVGNGFAPIKKQSDNFQANALRQPPTQPKNNVNQFGGNLTNGFKQAKNNLAEKTSNAIKRFGNRAEGLAQNVTDNVQKKLQPAFSPAQNNSTFNPANEVNQSSPLPPIASGNPSFDRSKELKPFAPVRNQKSNGRIQSQQKLGPNRAVPTGSGVTSSLNGPLKRPTQLPRASGANSNPPGSQISSLRGSRTNLSLPAAGSITAATPGDRKLEGLQAPTVTIEKIAPREIQVNQPADFQLVVKNTGRTAAQGVRVFDQIPVGTELVQSVPQPSRGANNQISWDLDTLNPGQEKTIRMQLRPLRPGEIGSVAQVTFSAQASMRTKVTKPVLAVQHSTAPRVLVGDPVILNIDVKNEGDGAARDVMIQEDLPEGLEFSEGFRELEYAIGTLGPGQSRKVRLELRAAKIGKYRNVLVAHAGGGLQTQHAVNVEVIAPSLSATGEGPTRRFLNRNAIHRFAVRNGGTARATNVELVCRLPNGLKFVDANNRGKYDENTHAVYWSLAELDVGLVANVELTTKPTEPGNQDLKLDVVADLNQSANAICKLNVEHLVDVFFDIDDMVDPIEIGSETSYRLRVVNQGTKTANNVQLQVDFPAGIQPTGVDGNITSNIRGQQIAFAPITSLNPGDTIEITIRGKGLTQGDHRVSVSLMADGREVNVSKQESTRVYSDR